MADRSRSGHAEGQLGQLEARYPRGTEERGSRRIGRLVSSVASGNVRGYLEPRRATGIAPAALHNLVCWLDTLHQTHKAYHNTVCPWQPQSFTSSQMWSDNGGAFGCMAATVGEWKSGTTRRIGERHHKSSRTRRGSVWQNQGDRLVSI